MNPISTPNLESVAELRLLRATSSQARAFSICQTPNSTKTRLTVHGLLSLSSHKDG